MDYDKVDYSRYYVKNKHTYNEVSENGEHEVEYTDTSDSRLKRHGKRRREGNSQKSHRRLHTVAIVVTMILLVAACTLLTVDTIKGGSVLASIENALLGTKTTHTYYGVEVGVYENMDSARLYANGIRKLGGAGYVLFDDGYRVLVEVYESHDDAENIAKRLRLEGENARLYLFEVDNIDVSLFSDSTRHEVVSAIEFNDRVYTSLYAIGVELAEGKIDENSAKMRIKGLYDETHNVLVEMSANVDRADKNMNVIKVKAELTSVRSMLDNLTKDIVQRPNLIADIRYTSCLIVNSYRELSRDLSKVKNK